MDKNRIEGRHGGMSWHHTAKSHGLAVEVKAAVAQGSSAFLPGEILCACAEGKSAEAVVGFNKPGNPMVPLKRRDRKT
jgi:hypothetical protein